MADLLPESLSAALSEDQSSSKDKSKKRKKGKITQIATWVECFTTYASVVCMQDPSRTWDLFAYMALIVHAARQYKGTEWQSYDTLFRKQAVDHKDWIWANINTSLWTKAFCNATLQDLCSTCLSLDHTTGDCPEAETPKTNSTDNSQPATSAKQQKPNTTSPSQSPICIRYNSRGCTSATCTYRHICLESHGNHRRTFCPSVRRFQPS